LKPLQPLRWCLGSIVLTPLALTGRPHDDLIRRLHHPQRLAWMTRLPPTFLPAFPTQTLRLAHPFFESVAGWRFAPLVAVFAGSCLQLLEALHPFCNGFPQLRLVLSQVALFLASLALFLAPLIVFLQHLALSLLPLLTRFAPFTFFHSFRLPACSRF
jgi:hypothetical protein